MALQTPSLDVGGAILVKPTPASGGRGYWQSVGRRLRRDPVTLICAAILILLVLLAQLVLGLLTIVASTGHMDGSVMVMLADWAQNVVLLRPVEAAAAATAARGKRT